MENDPNEVVLVMAVKPTEYSAVEALNRVAGLYAAAKKTFTIEFGDGAAEMAVVAEKVAEMEPVSTPSAQSAL